MYVVAGVTGHTGSATAEALLARRQPVRVVVREAAKGDAWKAKGAEIAVADLSDSAALTKALSGAKGAFLLLPPQYDAEDPLAAQRRLAERIAEAVKASGIPHVVFLSSIGAQHPDGTGPIRSLHSAEKLLAAAAKDLTLVRASYFLENWAPVLGEVKAKGVLPSFLTPGRAIPMVATKDIGKTAAEALLDPSEGTRVIELSGPRDFTPEDVAAALEKKLGRKLEVAGLPPEAAVPAFTSAGFSPSVARLFEEMYRGVNGGRVSFEGGRAIRKHGTLGPEGVL